MMMMCWALHPKSDIDRPCMKRKHGGRGLISIAMSVGLYMRGSNEMLLKDVRKVGIIKNENIMQKQHFKKNSQSEFKNK